MTKKYTVQIRDTASKLGKLYCLQSNIKLYVEDCTLYADFPESAQHEYISKCNASSNIYELFFLEYL